MTAIKAFSLLDEGWIAVQCQDGTQGRVGLTRFFEQADRIVGIADIGQSLGLRPVEGGDQRRIRRR